MEASDFLKALRSLVEQAWCCPRLPSLTVLVVWRCFSLVLGHCEVSLECLLLNRSKQFKNVQDPSSKLAFHVFPTWVSRACRQTLPVAWKSDKSALEVRTPRHRWYADGMPRHPETSREYPGVVQCRSNQKRSRYNHVRDIQRCIEM